MMDKEVLREIWHGQLPLCFKLNPDDVSGMHRPEPYYMMVPRVSYFPVVLDRVVKYFNRFMDTSKSATNDMWLDYEGQPIKWQHPIGLSWDLLGSSYELPWRLILHFSDFPANELIRCNTKSSVETNFISSVKEADALKHKGAVIQNMVKKDQNQLWSSLVNDKFEQFYMINKRLMDRIDNEMFRSIPFRLYLPDYTYVQRIVRPCTIEKSIFRNSSKTKSTKSDYVSDRSSNSLPTIYNQESVIANKSHKCIHTKEKHSESVKEGTVHRYSTMLDLVQVSFKNRLNELILPEESTNEKCGESDEDEEDRDEEEEDETTGETTQDKEITDSIHQSDTTTPGNNDPAELIDVRRFKYRFLSHGIEIPLDTPLQWLSEHLSYPDNFLHICAVVKDKPDNLAL